MSAPEAHARSPGRFALVRAPRLTGPILLALVVWLVWGGMVLAISLMTGDRMPVLCLFRRITGLPCPTCGSTRAALAALDGRPLDAISLNPLLPLAFALLGAWIVLRVGFGRDVVLRLGRTGRIALWTIVALLVLADWAYVIWRHRAG